MKSILQKDRSLYTFFYSENLKYVFVEIIVQSCYGNFFTKKIVYCLKTTVSKLKRLQEKEVVRKRKELKSIAERRKS